MIRQKLAKFMYGRYGIDSFYTFMIVLYFIITIINMILRSSILAFVSLVLLVYAMFRFFSKNTYKRRVENEKFKKLYANVLTPIKHFFNRIKGIKKYRYRKCPSCKSMLRLPKSKGKHEVICPCCKNKFNINIHF